MHNLDQTSAFVEIGTVGGLMPRDVMFNSILLDFPLLGHLDVKRVRDAPIQLVDIHRVQAILEPIMLGAQPGDRLLMLSAFVLMAFPQGAGDPIEYFVANGELPENYREFSADDLFPHVRLRAFPLEAGAVIINVTLLLDLADHRAPTVTAMHQAGEGELHLAFLWLARMAAVENVLHPFKQFARDKRFMPAFEAAAVPVVISREEAGP